MCSFFVLRTLFQTPLRLSARSRGRYHPAVHSHVTSASRDYYPLYLEEFICSSSWESLEAQQLELYDDEGAAPTRESEQPKQLTLTTMKDEKKKPARAPDAIEDEDVIWPEIE